MERGGAPRQFPTYRPLGEPKDRRIISKSGATVGREDPRAHRIHFVLSPFIDSLQFGISFLPSLFFILFEHSIYRA